MSTTIINACLAGASIIGTVVSVASIPDKQRTFKIFCVALCTLLFVTFSVSLIMSIPDETIKLICLVVLTVSLILFGFLYGTLRWNRLRNTTSIVQEEYRNAGIVKIGKFSPTDELADQLVNAKEVKICAFSASTLLLQATIMFDDALKNNVMFKLLIVKPGSKDIENIENIEGPARVGTIRNEIVTAISLIKGYNQKGYNGRITLRHFPETLPRLAIIICDNKCGTLTLNLPPRRAQDSVKIKMIKTEKGLLDDCINYFDSCWNLAEQVNV